MNAFYKKLPIKSQAKTLSTPAMGAWKKLERWEAGKLGS
jgi:hypothetical protein